MPSNTSSVGIPPTNDAEDQANRHLRKLFQLGLREIVLSLVVSPRFGGDPRIWNPARRGNVTGGIFGTVSFQKIEVSGVSEVIDLFSLPGAQNFTIVADRKPIPGSLDLFRERQRASREIEGLGRNNTCGLMVVMIFTDYVVRHPCQDYFGTHNAK